MQSRMSISTDMPPFSRISRSVCTASAGGANDKIQASALLTTGIYSGARTQAPLPIRMYLPESDIYIGPGQELWADLDLVPDPVIEGFQEVAVNININPRPEICRSFYFPRSRREQLRLVNADLDNPAAMLEKEKYWTQVLEGREVFFPMGFYHWVFPRVMLSFAPSGIYHTNMWCRLQELKKWVAHHTTWRQATAASAHITVYAYIPPRMLYVLFALGTPVRKGPRREDVDIIHFTFSQEVAQLIKDTHLHFMIPNLAGVFNDKPEDWVNSDTF